MHTSCNQKARRFAIRLSCHRSTVKTGSFRHPLAEIQREVMCDRERKTTGYLTSPSRLRSKTRQEGSYPRRARATVHRGRREGGVSRHARVPEAIKKWACRQGYRKPPSDGQSIPLEGTARRRGRAGTGFGTTADPLSHVNARARSGRASLRRSSGARRGESVPYAPMI